MDAIIISGQKFEEKRKYHYILKVSPPLYLPSNPKITLQQKPGGYHLNQVIEINITSNKTYLLPDMMYREKHNVTRAIFIKNA